MTEYTAAATVSVARRVGNWIAARQQAISDRAHASGDAYAAAQGWTVAAATGRFGFGTRTYHDARFDRLARPDSPIRTDPGR